jgi:signal recognition particle subunit SRP54
VREPSRVKRVARGSGQKEEAVGELIQKFLFMRQMMGGFGQNMGMLGNIPGFKQMAMANQMRKAAKSGFLGMGGMPGMGGFPGMGGMPGMGGFPGMGMPGMGMPGMGAPAPRMRTLSKTEKNAKKNQRKRERAARKKGKGKR